MPITGKSSLSLKKADLQSQKLADTSFRKIIFAHKASAGETSINLGTLTTPTELSSAGFTQPSAALLASANLRFYRSNLTLISSARGVLQDYLSYRVNSSTTIVFTDDFGETLEGEIFIGVIDAVPRNGLVGVDATTVLATGVLAAGDTEFNVGTAFKVNANPSTQVGEIQVSVDGVIQFRNSGNSAADPGADGNYQEIDNGSGYGTTIEFNESALVDRNIMVVGTGINVIRPNGSLIQELENLQGQIDGMVPTLAALAGVAESTFQLAPNSQDLKAFGDRVKGLEDPSSPGEPRLATSTTSGAVSSFTGDSTDLESGFYTPTLVNQTNITSSQAFELHYTRIGKCVTVAGIVNIDPTTSTSLTELYMSVPAHLPISATVSTPAGGTAANGYNDSFCIDRVSDTQLRFQGRPVDASNRTWRFSVMYRMD